MSKHVLDIFAAHGGTLRLHTKAAKILVSGGMIRGVELSDGEVITAPVVASNLDPSSTLFGLLDGEHLPDALVKRVGAIDHRAAYFQIHFALNGLPQYIGASEVLNDPSYSRNVTFFGRAEQMQRDFDDCVLGRVPASPSFNLQIPSIHEPNLAPPGKHAGSTFAFYFPIGATHDQQIRLRDEMAERIVAKITRVAPNFPDLIERQLNYPAHTYELMFGCTGGDFTHGLLQPEFMGPFRPGPRGWPDLPIPISGLYLCGAGCHGGPGITFIPGYNCGYEVLESASSARL